MPSPSPHSERIMMRLDQLATLSSDPGALTRLYLTPEHQQANTLVTRWMQEAGMTVRTDPLGSLIGRYEGQNPHAPALMLGSHLDTVRNAGKYDGTLGVVLAIECVHALHQQNERAPFPLEVVAFGDEEGVRFQAGLLGSRALTGTLPPDVLHLTDEAGITLAQALHDFGLDPNQLHRAARPASDILAYLEIHIEQGPVLETHDLPVGVVTGISGASRYKIDIHGQSGHAGTVPMQLRHDALTAAADVILALESLCRNRDDLVGTIGQIHAEPGAVNVIPGHATLTADLRAPQDQTRRQAAREFEAAISRITHQRGTPTILRQTYEVASTQCDPSLSRQLAHAIRAQGIHPHSLPSGAGHDAMAMAHLTDVAMLFVRCAGGVSHHPAEAVDPSDVTTVSNVVLHFIRALQRPARA